MHKKAGLSITVVVIAAMALIVLIVMIAIFAGKIDLFGKAAVSCAEKGGLCNDKIRYNDAAWEEKNKCPPEYATLLSTNCNFDNIAGNDACCVPVV